MMRLSDVVKLCGDRDPFVMIAIGSDVRSAHVVMLRIDPAEPDDDGVVTIEARK